MSIQPEPDTHPVLRVKAPWRLKAESYIMFLKLKAIPQGSYDQLQEPWGGDDYGKFERGLGAVMIVRYSDTPVGRSIHVLSKFRSLAKALVKLFF